jgi:hypothetical protein
MSPSRFGQLTAIKKVGSANGSVWQFRCDCGKSVERKLSQVKRTIKRGYVPKCDTCPDAGKHGGAGTRLHTIWINMRNRCQQPSSSRFACYGGRGIRVCDDWQDFETFRKWATASGYKEGLSIERVDVDGNYEPSNCAWIEPHQQRHNKQNSRKLTWNGKTLAPRQWAEELGISYEAIQLRVSRGWDTERIFTQPYRRRAL